MESFFIFKTLFLKPFLIATGISFLLVPIFIPLFNKWGLVDNPVKRKHPAHTHKGVIPRAGGLPIFLAIFICSLIFLPLSKQIIGIILGSCLAIIVGILDDKYDLSPYLRFAANILSALIVVGSGIGVPYITNPFGGIISLDNWRISLNFLGYHSLLVWADLFAIIWIVWCMNMVNWSKGVDGQMPGFVTISALTIGILSFRFVSKGDLNQWLGGTLAFITAGAYLGFLPWNFYPQKIMPGYGGGSLAGFLLAVLSILTTAKLGTAILVLGIPMSDALYTILRRIWEGRSPFWGDAGHLHHRLLKIGWGKRKIALFYWFFSAILGIVALTLNSKLKIFTTILIIVFVGGFLLWLSYFSTFSKPSGRGNG